MKQILIFLIAVLQVSLAFATGLSCDIIYINGEKWWLMAKPLHRDSIVYVKLNEFLPEERVVSTANWEGYTAYWTVTDGKVYLQKIDAHMYKPQTREEYTLTYDVDSLKNLFSSYYDGKGICAKWLNGEIRSGRGEVLRYVHLGFNRNMEEEYIMSVKDGVVMNHKHYHNYKKEGYNLMSVRRELEKRFPFKQFPEVEGKRILFVMGNFKISPDGHFLGCDVGVKLLNGLVKDQQHPAIKAFKAAMKDIYPWEVLYINGKYGMEFRTFAMALHYPTLTAHVAGKYREMGDSVCYLNMWRDTIIPFGKYRYCNSDTIRHIGFVMNKEIVCIDNKGNELFDVFRFDNGPDPVREGLFRIKDKAGKIGFADTLGNVVIKPQFAFAAPFENGKAKVTYTGEKKILDEYDKHWIWESDYWFYIDKNGDFVMDELD